MKKAVIWAIFAAIIECFSVQLAHAMGPECKDLFVAKTNDFYESENLRKDLIHNAQALAQIARDAREVAIGGFHRQLDGRSSIQGSDIEQAFKDSPTLAQIQLHPLIASNLKHLSIDPKTMELMREEGMNLLVVERAMQMDPYFAWLKNNAFFPVDPIAVFIEARKEGASPDLALIRMMHDLDPALSHKGVYVAGGAMVYNAIESILVNRIIPFLSSRRAVPTSDPWMLMPTVRKGENNVRRMLDQQVVRYGELVPRVAFERLQLAVNGDIYAGPVLSKYRLLRETHMPEEQIIAQLKPRLELFAEKIGLPKEFPIGRLYDLAEKLRVNARPLSYEMMLAEWFDPSSANLIRELRYLVDLAYGLSSMERFNAYIRNMETP